MKNALDGINVRVDEIGKNISELEDRAIESSQNKTQKK